MTMIREPQTLKSSQRDRDAKSKENGGTPGSVRQRNKGTMNIHAGREKIKQPVTDSEWLDEQIKRAQTRVISEVVDLTPGLARVLLARNPDNRKVSAVFVEEYARDIENGNWRFNGEPIVISKDGFLNDGQHRCEAVITAKKPIEVLIVVGPDRDSRLTVDQGKTRSSGDYLGMRGYTETNVLASVAGYIWQYRNYNVLSHRKTYRPTRSEIISTVKAVAGIEASMDAVARRGVGLVGGQSIIAFCHFVIAEMVGYAAAKEFTDALIDGTNLAAKDPILYVRTRLMSMRGHLRANEKAELIFKAWNAHRRGKRVTNMQISNGFLPAVER